jgi:hypothetical protein
MHLLVLRKQNNVEETGAVPILGQRGVGYLLDQSVI